MLKTSKKPDLELDEKMSSSAGSALTKLKQRRECGQNILALHYFFNTRESPAIFAMSVSIMERVLLKVKIEWKYLTCLSAACFYIACKWCEDEPLPTSRSIASLYSREWKEVDLARMERRVLSVLQWHVPTDTYLSHLPAMHAALREGCRPSAPPPAPLLPSLADCVTKAQLCLLDNFTHVKKLTPEAVALGVLTHHISSLDSSPSSSPQSLSSLHGVMDTLKAATTVSERQLWEVGRLLKRREGRGQDKGRLWSPHLRWRHMAAYSRFFPRPARAFAAELTLYDIIEENTNMDCEETHLQPPGAQADELDSSCSSRYSSMSEEEADDFRDLSDSMTSDSGNDSVTSDSGEKDDKSEPVDFARSLSSTWPVNDNCPPRIGGSFHEPFEADGFEKRLAVLQDIDNGNVV